MSKQTNNTLVRTLKVRENEFAFLHGISACDGRYERQKHGRTRIQQRMLYKQLGSERAFSFYVDDEISRQRIFFGYDDLFCKPVSCTDCSGFDSVGWARDAYDGRHRGHLQFDSHTRIDQVCMVIGSAPSHIQRLVSRAVIEQTGKQ